jgi:hypothetical protein
LQRFLQLDLLGRRHRFHAGVGGRGLRPAASSGDRQRGGHRVPLPNRPQSGTGPCVRWSIECPHRTVSG